MAKQKMTLEIMEYMVWVIEIVAHEFFSKDKTAAYNALKKSKIWDLYIEHYIVTHTLGKEYLLNEIKEALIKNGIHFKEVST